MKSYLPFSNSSYAEQMITTAQKNANDFEWYKNNMNYLIASRSDYHTVVYDSEKNKAIRRYNKMKVNYDLCDNILNMDDFANVVKPYGIDMGMMPVNFENYDIISSKVTTLKSIFKQYPFDYQISATNSEATTRRIEKENELLKENLERIVMADVDQKLQEQVMMLMQQQGGKLTPEQQEQVMQQVAEQRQAMTPKEVHLYMERDYKDEAEILMNHLLTYYTKKLDIETKVNDCVDDFIKVGRAMLYKGIFNGEPELIPVKPTRFYYELNDTSRFIEDSEWCVCEYRMTPTMIANFFGKDIKEKELQELMEEGGKHQKDLNMLRNPLYYMSNIEEDQDGENSSSAESVYHCCWRGMRKIGFATVIDLIGGEVMQMMVDDSFTPMSNAMMDVTVEWKWIPEAYEGWLVRDKYMRMRPVEGQYKDMDAVYNCKLPYIGVVQKSNSNRIVSIVDKLKPYQYMLNIVMFRLNILMGNDKGKKLLLNSIALARDDGTSSAEWLAMFNATGIGLVNPNDIDGAGNNDLAGIAKELNLNSSPDIAGYLRVVAEIKEMAREVSNVSRQLEGMMLERDGADVTSQSIRQSSSALYDMLELFNQFKANIVKYLIEDIKICFRGQSEVKKSYMTDDAGQVFFEINGELLDNTTYGLFVEDASITDRMRGNLYQLIHASMQNNTLEFSRALDLLEQNNVTEAKNLLAESERLRKEREDAIRKEAHEQQLQILQMEMEAKQKEHEMKMAEIKLKEEERRKTELAKQAYLGASFNPETDINPQNKVNDYFERAMFESNRDYEEERNNEAMRKQQMQMYEEMGAEGMGEENEEEED